ncbi:hypothetical protein AB0I51_46525 [Streptomyces sp. NPDC050549]|uniref:hypothetical protein n=1 Tax=Streptomyces sp. NPDC050549 TaxID=3155406 RepID=UPI0034321CE2
MTSEQHDVTAVCFPDVQRHRGASDSYGLQGTINPATAHHAFHYELKLTEPVGDNRDPWRGASGAAVFCDGLLIGCIQATLKGDGALYVMPADRFLLHRCFHRLVAEDSDIAPVLEPVALRPYLTAPLTTLRTPAQLLEPEAAIMPMQGRAPDILLAWCRERCPGTPGVPSTQEPDRRVRVRLLCARSGLGKTRAAVEAARQLTAITGTRRSDWTAGFLASDPEGEPNWNQLLGNLTKSLLLVVDHAETRGDQLSPLLDALHAYRGSHRIRVLLLARSQGQWLRELPPPWNRLNGQKGSSEVTDTVQALYRDALLAFAVGLQHMQGYRPHGPGQPGWTGLAELQPALPALRERGGEPSIGDVQLHALSDLLKIGGRGAGPDPRLVLLAQEHDYVLRALRARQLSVDHDLVTLILTATALFASPDENATVTEVQAALGYRFRHVAGSTQAIHSWEAVRLASDITDILAELYPSREHAHRGALPDAVAAGQLAEAESNHRGRGFAERVFQQATPAQRKQAQPVLTSAHQLYPESARDVPKPGEGMAPPSRLRAASGLKDATLERPSNTRPSAADSPAIKSPHNLDPGSEPTTRPSVTDSQATKGPHNLDPGSEPPSTPRRRGPSL